MTHGQLRSRAKGQIKPGGCTGQVREHVPAAEYRIWSCQGCGASIGTRIAPSITGVGPIAWDDSAVDLPAALDTGVFSGSDLVGGALEDAQDDSIYDGML